MGQTQPEGLALATVLSGWGTVANVMVVPLFYSLQRRLSWRIERWVWVGLLLQLSSAVLAALSWRVTLGPTSPCLYAVSFLSCIGGNFQQLAVVPWVQEGAARPACVSWTMAGSNLGAVVAAIFGAIQQPGRHGDDGRLEQRFTVGTFFTAVALVVLVGIGCMRTTPTPHHTHAAPHPPRTALHAAHTTRHIYAASMLHPRPSTPPQRLRAASAAAARRHRSAHARGACGAHAVAGWHDQPTGRRAERSHPAAAGLEQRQLRALLQRGPVPAWPPAAPMVRPAAARAPARLSSAALRTGGGSHPACPQSVWAAGVDLPP